MAYLFYMSLMGLDWKVRSELGDWQLCSCPFIFHYHPIGAAADLLEKQTKIKMSRCPADTTSHKHSDEAESTLPGHRGDAALLSQDE